VKGIPIRENLFVAFVNGPQSLHGAGVSPGSKLSRPRLAYQTHLCPVRLDRLTDPAARLRWQRFVDERAKKTRKQARKAQKAQRKKAAQPPRSTS
jgi:hypothetical protein